MRGVHTRKTYKDLERPITTRGGGGALHYCAQVLTDSMCVYTSYIVPHAAAATAGTRPSGLLLHYSEGQQGATGRWHLVGLNRWASFNPAPTGHIGSCCLEAVERELEVKL